MKNLSFCLAIVAAFASSAAYASGPVTAETMLRFLDDKESRELALSYIQVASVTYTFANSEFEMKTGKRIYCTPKDLALSAEQSESALRIATIKSPSLKDAPFQLALLFGYKIVFPCK